jgi:hypothetical protein
LRASNSDKLSRDHLEGILTRIAGKEDPEGNGDHPGGFLFKHVIDEDKKMDNLEIYPFYRTLSKHWHYVSMGRKEIRLRKKSNDLKAQMAMDTNELEKFQLKVDLLKELIVVMDEDITPTLGARTTAGEAAKTVAEVAEVTEVTEEPQLLE